MIVVVYLAVRVYFYKNYFYKNHEAVNAENLKKFITIAPGSKLFNTILICAYVAEILLQPRRPVHIFCFVGNFFSRLWAPIFGKPKQLASNFEPQIKKCKQLFEPQNSKAEQLRSNFEEFGARFCQIALNIAENVKQKSKLKTTSSMLHPNNPPKKIPKIHQEINLDIWLEFWNRLEIVM